MLLLKILCLALGLCLQDGHWLRVTARDGLSFLFPNTPQVLEKNTNGIPSTIYQTKDLGCVAGVVCSRLDSSRIVLDGETVRLMYEELKAGTLDIETAILKKETSLPYDNMLIKEIEYAVISGKFEMTYFKRFIFRDNCIYQLTIGGRSRHRDILERDRETFFNSFVFPHAGAGKPVGDRTTSGPEL